MSNSRLKKHRFLKRLADIKEIDEKINNNESVTKYSRLSRIAYILWKYPQSRENYIELALQYYKIFYPEQIKNNYILVDDFFKIPKMYDIQRDGATIQNTERLFEPSVETRIKRKKKQEESKSIHQNLLNYDTNHYLYLDESGKNDKYFFLAGILINGKANRNKISSKLSLIKNNLLKKYKINISELKFTEINKKTIKFYKEFLKTSISIFPTITFCSIGLDEKNLKQSSKKVKNFEMLKSSLEDILYLTLRKTLNNIDNSLASMFITLDKDGPGIDKLEKENITNILRDSINSCFNFFATIADFKMVDSKSDILIQFADLYVSSINNIFSEKNIESETMKLKREFAELFIDTIGLKNLKDNYQKDKSNIEFINKFID